MQTNIEKKGIKVKGIEVDAQTRCKHYRSDLDIIAIKFPCCQNYYPCYSCHEETADHPSQVWHKLQFDEKAILCGSCGTEMTIHQYLHCDSACPSCAAHFNPGCCRHYHLYFEM